MTNNELYVSIDVEADGPIPGEYSMLSLGSAIFEPAGQILDKFEVNIRELPTAKRDAETMEWWATEPTAWEYCRRNPVEADNAMHSYLDHLLNVEKKYRRKLVCIGYPVTYDFMFVYWYLIKFTGKSPFSFSGIDIKTMAMTIMKSSYKKAGKKYMPRQWFSIDNKHNHTPLEDAIEQGNLFCNMLKEVYQ
jgi:hypothetical protein